MTPLALLALWLAFSRSDIPTLLWRPSDQWQGSARATRESRPQGLHAKFHVMHLKLAVTWKILIPKLRKKITDSWECGREHNLRFWWRWHQPFRSCLSNTRATYTYLHNYLDYIKINYWDVACSKISKQELTTLWNVETVVPLLYGPLANGHPAFAAAFAVH